MNTENHNPDNPGDSNDREVDRVGTLLRKYIAEHKAGGRADPVEYLEMVDGSERRELAALIDAYLIRSPGQPWNPDAMAGSPAERLVRRIESQLNGESGEWPKLLPDLRNSARISRRKLVESLANSLGFPDKVGKVALYYHEMEQGNLPAAGVSDRVLEALAGIVGSSASALRRAGDEITAAPIDRDAAVFARTVSSDSEIAWMVERDRFEGQIKGIEIEPDEVDKLFTGGP